MESFYKLRVSIGRISFELESHDKDWLESKEKSLMGNLLSNPDAMLQLSKLEDKDTGQGETVIKMTDSGITVNEYYQKYIKGKNWSRQKMALFLIYYLEKIRHQTDISTTDIKSAFREIAYPKYDSFNYTHMLNMGKKRGHLNKVDGKWKLTVTGVDFVLSELQAD